MSLPLPYAVSRFPDRVEANGIHFTTLFAKRWPSSVVAEAMQRIYSLRLPVDISLHVSPVDPAESVKLVRRLRADFESTRKVAREKDTQADESIEVAAEDSRALHRRLVRDETRLYEVGAYFTIRAGSPEELAKTRRDLERILNSKRFTPRLAWLRADEGRITTLPLGVDLIGYRKTLDTQSLAECIPFATGEIEGHDAGILVGENVTTGSPVFTDCWALLNHNANLLAESGAGKSYAAKLWLLRSLLQGDQATVIDVESEYERLAGAAGGVVVRAPREDEPRPAGQLVVYSLRDLEEAERQRAVRAAMQAAWEWADRAKDEKRRIVQIDEGWQIMAADPICASYVHSLAKTSRKRDMSVRFITQDLSDLLKFGTGEASLTNAETVLLMRQKPRSLPALVAAFDLSDGEAEWLKRAPQGQGLLIVGDERCRLEIKATEIQHGLCLSNEAWDMAYGTGARAS